MNFIVSRIQHEISAVRIVELETADDGSLEIGVRDEELADLIRYIKDGSMVVENAVVENDELRMINSKLEDYGVIALGETEDDDSIVRDGIVILYNLVDSKTNKTVGYTVADPMGNVNDYTCAELLDISKNSAIVNADTVNNAGNLLCVPTDKPYPKTVADFEVVEPKVVSAKNESVASEEIVSMKILVNGKEKSTRCGVGGLDNALEALGIHGVKMEKRVNENGESFLYLTRGLPDAIITEACHNLLEIELPPSVEIGYNVFANVRNLRRVSCSSATIGKGAFMMCVNLERFECFDVVEIDDLAFFGCTKLFDIVFPETLTKIGYNAFDACGLTDVKIPNSVTTLNSMAFANNEDLREAEVPMELMKVWAKTCKDFNEAVANKTLSCSTSATMGTFANCKKLVKINLRSSDIIRLGDYQFIGCTELMRKANEQ